MKAMLMYFCRRKLLFLLVLFPLLFAFQKATAQDFSAHAVFSDSARDAGYLQGTLILNDLDTVTTDIEVMVGSAQNDSLSVFQVFDNNGGLPAGFSYLRTGNNVVIGVTSAVPLWTYYCRVRIKSSGIWSDPYRFITN